jgi:hypothetical protein
VVLTLTERPVKWDTNDGLFKGLGKCGLASLLCVGTRALTGAKNAYSASHAAVLPLPLCALLSWKPACSYFLFNSCMAVGKGNLCWRLNVLYNRILLAAISSCVNGHFLHTRGWAAGAHNCGKASSAQMSY